MDSNLKVGSNNAGITVGVPSLSRVIPSLSLRLAIKILL
jgi:hypothetical protein